MKSFYDWNDSQITCTECNWSGMGKETAMGESFDSGAEYHCPQCQHYFGYVAFPLIEEAITDSRASEIDRLLAQRTLERSGGSEPYPNQPHAETLELKNKGIGDAGHTAMLPSTVGTAAWIEICKSLWNRLGALLTKPGSMWRNFILVILIFSALCGIETAFSEKSFTTAFLATFLAQAIHGLSLFGALALTLWLAKKWVTRYGVLGFLAGLIISLAIFGTIRLAAEEIPGIGWRLQAIRSE